MADYPDIYMDGYSCTVGPFGITLTLLRSRATDESGTALEGNEVIARVRMSKELGEHLAEAIRNTVAQSKKGVAGPTSAKSH